MPLNRVGLELVSGLSSVHICTCCILLPAQAIVCVFHVSTHDCAHVRRALSHKQMPVRPPTCVVAESYPQLPELLERSCLE